MNKKNLQIISVIALAAGAYFVYRYFKGGKSQPKLSTEPTKDTEVSKTEKTVTAPVTQTFPLKKGSTGKKVLELQNALLSVSRTLLPKYGADGNYGSETEAAVYSLLKKKTIDSQDDITKIIQFSKPSGRIM